MCGVLGGDTRMCAAGLWMCLMLVAIGNVVVSFGVFSGNDRRLGEVGRVLSVLLACLEAWVVVVFGDGFFDDPVPWPIVVVRLKPMCLGVEVPHSPSILGGLLGL